MFGIRLNPSYASLRAGAVLGLVAAFTGALLLLGLVRYEFAYNATVDPVGRTYQIYTRLVRPGAPPVVAPGTGAELAAGLRARFPDLRVARLAFGPEPQEVRVGAVRHFEMVAAADAEITQVLEFPTLAGDLAGALAVPDGAAITDVAAQRLFGSTANAVGQTVDVAGSPHRIGAVLRDPGPNSGFARLAIVISGRAPTSVLGQLDAASAGAGAMVVGATNTFVRLSPGLAEDVVERAATRLSAVTMARFAARNPAVTVMLRQDHALLGLRDPEGPRAVGGQPDPRRIDSNLLRGIVVMAALVMVGAVLNTANLEVAVSIAAARDTAVRKVYGAARRDLIAAAGGRGVLWALLAMAIAWFAAYLAKGAFGTLLQRPIDLDFDLGVLGFALALAVVAGTIAAIYPAYLTSGVSPASILRARGAPPAGSRYLRQGLVGVQLAVSIALIAVAAVMYLQFNHAMAGGVAFSPADKLAVRLSVPVPAGDPRGDAIRSTMLASPGISAAAFTDALPSEGAVGSLSLRLPGGSPVDFATVGASPTYLDVLGSRIVAGRSLGARDERAQPGGTTGLQAVVIGSAAISRLGAAGAEAVVGRQLVADDGRSFVVVGVVEDIPLGGMRQADPPPAAYLAGSESGGFLLLSFDPTLFDRTAAETRLRRLLPDAPMDSFLLSDRVAAAYADVRRLVGLVTFFALMGVTIALTGMTGVAALESQASRSDMTVRKVFGAGPLSIFLLFLAQLAAAIAIGTLIGMLGGTIFAEGWLAQFADRYGSPVPTTLGAGAAVAILVLLTAGWFAAGIARRSSAASLRDGG